MIYNLKCNGWENPISVDRRAVFSWQTDFSFERFSVKIEKGGEVVLSEEKNSRVCIYESDIDFESLSTYTATFTLYNGAKTEEASINFRTALVGGFPKECKWIGKESLPLNKQSINGNPATYLWRNFDVEKIEPTYLHVAGLGLFYVKINGKRVSEDVLNAPFTNYDESVLYSSYDITDCLKVGENRLEIVLGDGWYNQTATDEWDFYKASWRDNCKAILYIEGGVQLFSDGSFNCSTAGRITSSSIRLGERVDFTKNAESEYAKAVVMKSPNGKLKSIQEFPIREVRELKYKTVKSYDGGYIFDFETSITGYVRLTATFDGLVKIRYGDRLDEKGRIDNSSNGQYVYGGEYQTDFVKGNGKINEYKPCFTYHAFRYVEIEGLEQIPDDNQLIGVFIRSSFPKVGDFYCDDVRLNLLYELSIRSIECNFTGFPTDCPHREKNGWTGDMQLTSSAFIKNFDGTENLIKWLEDIVEAQKDDGVIPCIVPTASWGYTWGNGPAWDYALFVLPYEIYKFRGDISAIKTVFNCCEKYLEYIYSKQVDGLYEIGLGDWNYPKNISFEPCPLRLTTSCFVYSMTKIFAEFCSVLGYREKAENYVAKSAEIKSLIEKEFILPENFNGITARSAVLYFGLVDGKKGEKIFSDLVELVEKSGYKSLFGILGAKFTHNVLCARGREDVFIKMMKNSEYPSFGYWIERDATTLWEDFEGTNSRNHHMFSDIISVMQTYLLGVRQNFVNGEGEITVKPYVKEFTSLRGKVITVNGVTEVDVSVKEDCVLAKVVIPYGVRGKFVCFGKEVQLQGGLNEIKVIK